MSVDGECQRDEVVQRMNEYRAWEEHAEQKSIVYKHQEVSIRRSNCYNGVVRGRGIGYEMCREKESE